MADQTEADEAAKNAAAAKADANDAAAKAAASKSKKTDDGAQEDVPAEPAVPEDPPPLLGFDDVREQSAENARVAEANAIDLDALYTKEV